MQRPVNMHANEWSHRADAVVVLDFETTGLTPRQGDRAIEIGAVKLHRGKVIDRFQELMNPGIQVSSFIENYTGISNAMLQDARSCSAVMADFADFLGAASMVAHNAGFDRRFLEAELARIGRSCSENYGCSLLLTRRVYPQAPSHRLSELVAYRQIAPQGRFHRALADAEMTTLLWLQTLDTLAQEHGVHAPSFAWIQQLSRLSKAKCVSYLNTVSQQNAQRDVTSTATA